jgi:hypothetical protein
VGTDIVKYRVHPIFYVTYPEIMFSDYHRVLIEQYLMVTGFFLKPLSPDMLYIHVAGPCSSIKKQLDAPGT